MLRIFLLVIVGFFVASAALQAIKALLGFVRDMSVGGAHAPEFLGALTASILLVLGCGWLWRKIYRSGLGLSKSESK